MDTHANYIPLIDGLRDFGISRTRGFELVKAGLLDTFTIGRRRYVLLDSLRTLPERANGWTRGKEAPRRDVA
jgi:hypothetical protein